MSGVKSKQRNYGNHGRSDPTSTTPQAENLPSSNIPDILSEPVHDALEKLYRAIRLTLGARFIAERRLRWHDRFTQTTLMLHSIALIALPVFRMAGFESRYGSNIANSAEVLLAVFVLSLGLLLGQGNFALRAEGMNRCARELLRMERLLEIVRRRQSSEQEYLKFAADYATILETAEAHRPIDFARVLLQHRSDHYAERSIAYIRDSVWYLMKLTIEYSLYILSLIVPIVLLMSMIPSR